MPIEWTYTPPKVNGILLVQGAKKAVEIAGAHVLLAASQPLVPVDTGEMKASGTVDGSEDGATVSYFRTGADGYNVAARMHEDATQNHPGGGTDHFLSKPMKTEEALIVKTMDAELWEILG